MHVVVNYFRNFKKTEKDGTAGTVYANLYDKKEGEYHVEKAGNGDSATELQEIFASKEQAITAALAKFKRTKKQLNFPSFYSWTNRLVL